MLTREFLSLAFALGDVFDDQHDAADLFLAEQRRDARGLEHMIQTLLVKSRGQGNEIAVQRG